MVHTMNSGEKYSQLDWIKCLELVFVNYLSKIYLDFSIGYPKDKNVISGMRKSCEIYIEVDLIRAVQNKIKFYISKNSVVLSPGNDGVIPSEFFKIVKTNQGKVIFSQKYDYVLFILFEPEQNLESYYLYSVKLVNIVDNKICKEFDIVKDFNPIKSNVNFI